MDITLHMLNGYLLASKAYLNAHLKETAEFERQAQTVSNLGLSGQPDTPEVTREELKNALLAAQVDTCTHTHTCLILFSESSVCAFGIFVLFLSTFRTVQRYRSCWRCVCRPLRRSSSWEEVEEQTAC